MRPSKFEITKKNYRRLVSIILVIFNILLFAPSNVFLEQAYGATSDLKEAPLTLTKTIDKDRYKVNEEIIIDYKIQPDSIPMNDIVPDSYLKQKEIVLVIDTSGSMSNNLNNKTRLQVAKDGAKRFVSKFKDDKRVKVAIVSYSSYAKDIYNFTKLSNENEYRNLIREIDRLRANGGTNIGDGLRKAYYKFSNSNNDTRKYVILMTDGKPTFHSSTWRWMFGRKREKEQYFGNGTYSREYYHFGGGHYSTYADKEYANKVARDLILNGNHKIDSFMVAFSNDADKTELKNIANSAKGYYKEAVDANSLDEVYQKLADQIKSDLPINNINFNETFPQGIVPIEGPKGLVIDGQTVKGDIGSISYKLNKQTKQFEANPINFSIKLRANKVGDYSLSNQNSYIEYRDIDENNKRKMFSKKSVLVYEENKLPKIDIKVRDTSGDTNQFNITSEDSNKKVEKILNPSIILQGDAYADISVEGEDTNFFEYQFIKNSKIPTSNWQSIDLNSETINKDVIKEKQGYLNKRSYDVSHGIVAGSGTSLEEANKRFWSHRDKVFKNPLSSTEYMKASYSTSKQNYGKWEEYTKQDGTKAQIWKTNSIFLDNMMIDMNYKEASKFWGYIKVDNTGDYKFGAHSDDGCRGYITANKETKDFVNMFVLQSRNPRVKTNNNGYHLEADKYYPIYLEYFNWGGWANFELKYSKNNGTWNRVPQNWFYPSKDNSPGEHSTTIFTGNKGVKFPSESGDYYIAFKTGKDGNVTREGIYGPFTVEGKTQLTISKEIIDGNKVQEKNNFILEYTINPPAKIDAIGSFMENGEYKDKIYLTNVQIIDEYPKNIEIESTLGQKIIKYINDIEYTKSIENGKTVYKYIGNPIKVRVNLKAKKIGNYLLSENSKSKITFTDFNQRINREQEFAPINITAVEKKQAEFDFNRTIDKDNVQVNEEFEITYEITPKIIESIDSSISNLSDKDVIKNIIFTEKLPKEIKIDKDELPQGVTVKDNTITWNIGSITYELNKDKTKYIPSIGDKKLKIVVTASSEEEGTYNLENAAITYEDIDQSTVSKNIDEVDTITVENKIKITTGVFINGQFQSNNEIDLVKGFDIELGVKIESVKDKDIILEVLEQNKINVSNIQVYKKTDDTKNLINDINIVQNGKAFKIKTSDINTGQRSDYIIMYNVKASKKASEDTTDIKIKVDSQDKTHKIKIVPLPNLE